MKVAPHAIDIDMVSKRYNAVPVLENVSFSVTAGTICGLTGPNGAGKSSLMRVLVGLADADSGSARVHGVAYRDCPAPTRLVGTVLDGTGVAPRDSARTHLRRVARFLDLSRERVDEVLAEVGLLDAADQPCRGYSLGMGQRLALANALLAEPQVLVLDEPTNGLDPDGMRWLRRRLVDFAETGGTVLISSHHLLDLQHIADQVVILEKSVVFDGSIAELGINAERLGALEEAFLSRVGAAQ